MKYLCAWLEVSRSGYYDWCKRKISAHALEDQQLTEKILDIHQRSCGTYGSPRVHVTLQAEGYSIGRKRVERLMKEQALVGRVVKITRRQPDCKRFKAHGHNIKRLEPAPTKLNQAWVGNVTYLKVKGKWRYLATVMDTYSRHILGWSLGKDRTVNLTIRALNHAVKGRELGKNLLFHTDRGIEYTAYKFQCELIKHGMRHSVNRPGHCSYGVIFS